MSENSCREECAKLLDLASQMQTVLDLSLDPKAHDVLNEWTKHANSLLSSPSLETLDGEQALENLSLDLRHRWLNQSHKQSSHYMMSPPHQQRTALPGGLPMVYPYDRWLKPTQLEQKLDHQRPPPEGWTSKTCVFASGMAAITTFLQVYRAFSLDYWPRSKNTASLHWFGGYFEVRTALEVICGHEMKGRKHVDQAGLNDAVATGGADIVLIEPVASNLDLDVFDMDTFSQAWQQRSTDQPGIIVLDTSLSGDIFPLEQLCQKLTLSPVDLVVNIRSGLKMDQYGLEFSNLGLMSLWTKDDKRNQAALDSFTKTLKKIRTTFGVGLSESECSALAAPFILDDTALKTHSLSVFKNNRRLAISLNQAIKKQDSLFIQASHPSKGGNQHLPWAEAPYINLRYRSQDASNRLFLKFVIDFEAIRRKLSLRSGSSFGFRSHRFEMGFVRGAKYSSLRIAMGSRAGPSCEGIIDLFKELAAYPDFKALRAAYPDIVKRLPNTDDDSPKQDEHSNKPR